MRKRLKMHLQFFASGMSDKRFKDIQNMERKELFKLDQKELEQAASKGDLRAEAIVKELELDNLRKFKEEKEAEEAAQEQAERIAEEIVGKSKEVESDIEEKVNSRVDEILQEKGVNLQNKYTRRLVEQKMHNDSMQKNIYSNSGYGRESLSPEMKNFVHWTKTGEVMDRKFLNGNTNADGGFLVPTEFHNEVLRKMEDFAVVRRAGARVLQMTRDKMTVPVLDSKGSGGWQGTTQGNAYTQSEPTFADISLEPKKYDRLATATYEMLEDEAVNVADLLADIFAEDFALAEDAAFLAGDGTNMPEGMDVNANVAVMNLDTQFQISDKDIINLVYKLKRAYRTGAVFFVHDSAVAMLRTLKSNGSYLWSDGNLTAGEPARLAGYPVYTTDAIEQTDVDGGTAGDQAGSRILFANPKYYYIGDRQGFRLRRSTERYFEEGKVAFAADKRVDGKVALPDAFVKTAPIKH